MIFAKYTSNWRLKRRFIFYLFAKFNATIIKSSHLWSFWWVLYKFWPYICASNSSSQFSTQVFGPVWNPFLCGDKKMKKSRNCLYVSLFRFFFKLIFLIIKLDYTVLRSEKLFRHIKRVVWLKKMRYCDFNKTIFRRFVYKKIAEKWSF